MELELFWLFVNALVWLNAVNFMAVLLYAIQYSGVVESCSDEQACILDLKWFINPKREIRLLNSQFEYEKAYSKTFKNV